MAAPIPNAFAAFLRGAVIVMFLTCFTASAAFAVTPLALATLAAALLAVLAITEPIFNCPANKPHCTISAPKEARLSTNTCLPAFCATFKSTPCATASFIVCPARAVPSIKFPVAPAATVPAAVEIILVALSVFAIFPVTPTERAPAATFAANPATRAPVAAVPTAIAEPPDVAAIENAKGSIRAIPVSQNSISSIDSNVISCISVNPGTSSP